MSTQDWRDAPAVELIAHILSRFHDRHREQLPELIRLAQRVETVHGDRPDCPNGLASHLAVMQQELLSHMQKEEQVLFPMLARGMGAMAAAPITVMRMEHDDHGAALQRLAELTGGLTLPAEACNTWRALYDGLQAFCDDLQAHIELENDVLFENAVRPAAQPAHPAHPGH
ncbi:iron-sulfur cluster repair di-iron protein [Cupriavidus agavae]|uniref:Iron-sulfur cluster repair di-iron protein n=1 Tax=Cupriavidus agavae TaxID=1001822 RepID=A0A4Q7RI12_9BURK|nr:iron-sulfur cluster repair di-iron protein [Cupriavidus agavae]